MKSSRIETIIELQDVARLTLELCTKKEHAQVFALRGDLGAGKTAFTKELGKVLGIGGEITSPTFVIMKTYEIPKHPFFKRLVHIDAYRIESDDEMRVLGFAELLKDPAILMCIEWPEKIQNLIPPDARYVDLVIASDGTRTIHVDV